MGHELEKNDLLVGWLRKHFKCYKPPSSTGYSGFIVCDYHNNEFFIYNSIIKEVLSYIRSIRTGFIRGDYLWTLPADYIKEIHEIEFEERMFLKIKEI